MNQFIKITDSDVDGCGTNLETSIQIEGESITNGVIARIKDAISDYKNECDGDWDTDGCVEAAWAQLEKEGYQCTFVDYAAEIEI